MPSLRGLSLLIILLLSLILPASLPLVSMLPAKKIDNLKVGVLLPLSGAHSSLGLQIIGGMQLALAQHAKLPHRDWARKIHLLVRDTQGLTSRGEQLATELLSLKRAHVLIGGLSATESLTYAQLTQSHEKMLISLLPRHIQGLTSLPYAFSFASSYSWQIRLLGAHLTGDLKLQPHQVALVVAAEEDDQQTSSSLQALTQALGPGAQITDIKVFAAPLQQRQAPWMWDELAQNIIEAQHQALIITLPWHPALLLLDALQKQNFRAQALGLDLWDHPSFAQKAAPFPFPIHHLLPYHVQYFTDTFRGLKSEEQPPTTLEALGYDVMLWLLHLYARGQSARIPALVHHIRGPLNIFGGSSTEEQIYQMGEDHFLQKPMVLVSPGNRYPQLLPSSPQTTAPR